MAGERAMTKDEAMEHSKVWMAAAIKIEQSVDYTYEIDYQETPGHWIKKKIMSSELNAVAQLARAVSQSYAELG